MGGVGKQRRGQRHRDRRRRPSTWDEAFALSSPFLLPSGTALSHQPPALERWSAEYLSAHLADLRVHVCPRPTVQMTSLAQPLGQLPELSWRRPYTERNVSGAEFFRPAPCSTHAPGGASRSPPPPPSPPDEPSRVGGGAREQELPGEQSSDQLSGGETFLRYGLWAVLLLLLCACALTYYLVRRKRASPPQPGGDALNTTIDASSSNGADEAGGVYADSREVKVS